MTKAFRDKNYNVIVGRESSVEDSGGWTSYTGVTYPKKTETSFPVSLNSPDYASAISWEACGYSA